MRRHRLEPALLRPAPHGALRRRGAMLVLVAALIAILLTMTVFSVDVAYMQLVRTQLRVAADAAAKAGVEALTRTGDADQAVAAAIAAAARNEVAGRPLVLTTNEVKLGRGQSGAGENWTFQEGGTPYTAVRIDVTMSSGSSAGDVDLMFASAIGSGKYTPHETSTAAHLEQEIVLCIDRSHSMCFDLSGVSWRYPAGHSTHPHGVCYPPQPIGSRWAALEGACQLFVDTLSARDGDPRVALVTWGSDIGRHTAEYYYTGRTEVEVTREMPLSHGYPGLMQHLENRRNGVMLGGTNMSSGIDESISILTHNNVRPLSNKTVILMSDGQWNHGRDPVLAAADAAAAGIIIHTVSFLSADASTTMQQVAAITGGRHYHATNEAQLEAAFRDLALTLPVVLTE